MTDLAADFAAHRGAVFGLAYRMMGTVPDADEVVQEAFLRAVERAPERRDSLRPWLMRVAMNVARDRLRRRRRRGYTGPWLPGPIDLEDARLVDDAPSPEARVSRQESLSYAFLLALEVLTPGRRAVLLLRDVYDCSVAETGRLLGMSESNVKTTLHRARKSLDAHEGTRRPVTPETRAAALGALMAFGAAVQRGDAGGVRAILADDVVLRSDGGGRYHAAMVPVVGASKIAKMYLSLMKHTSPQLQLAVRELNGMPAVVAHDPGVPPGFAQRWVLRCDVDAQGRIAELYSVLADEKTAGVSP